MMTMTTMVNTPLWILKMRLPLFLCAAVLLSSSFQRCSATDITWHANVEDAGSNDPAKTAPKSQKFWDENNIPKPDYAYTDAEFRAMKNVGNVSVVSSGMAGIVTACFVLGMVAGLYVLYVARRSTVGIGTVLGSGQSTGPIPPVDAFVQWLRSAMNSPSAPSLHRPLNDNDQLEKARLARLARFQASASAEKAD